MKDKLGPQFPVLWESDDPTDLFRFLENNMTEVESLEILKHILGVMNYYPALSNQSLNKIIAEYEQKMKEIEVKCKLHRDAYFIGRHQEKKFIRSRLASNDKGLFLFLYPATQKVAGYYVIPSEAFECPSGPSVRSSVRASVRQRFVSVL